MPVRLTLYTEDEIQQLIELGAAVSDQEFCCLWDALQALVDDVEGPLVALRLWSGHDDGSLDDFAERYLATAARPAVPARSLRVVNRG